MAIIRALLHDPEVILMDEPTNSLDPITSKMLKEFVKEKLVKEKGKTIFWASHRLEEINGLCDRVALINKAKIIFIGTVNEFRNILKYNNRYIIRVINTHRNISELSSIFCSVKCKVTNETENEIVIELSKVKDYGAIANFMSEILKKGWEIISFKDATPSLEDVFHYLVQDSDKQS